MRNVILFGLVVLFVSLLLGQGCPSDSDDSSDGVASDSMGGTHDVGNLSIPTGKTVTVTSDLVINATGDVKIAGLLIAKPTEDGDDGCTITINAGGNIEITGMVQAGNGTDATTETTTMRTAATIKNTDPGGTNGGSVELIAKGDITIDTLAILTCGSGGSGADGDWGGAAGKGGDLVLDAGGTLTMRGSVYIGNGGNAGMAAPTVETIQSLDPDQEFSFGATGGSSGFLFLRAGQVDWPTYDAATHSLDYLGDLHLSGGYPGNASSINIIGEAAYEIMKRSRQTIYEASAPMHICTGTNCTFRAPDGVDSFILGGLGGSITVEIKQLEADQWDAPSVIVYAGNGGNLVQPPSYKYKDVLAVLMRNGWAGAGGNAAAVAPAGHNGDVSRMDAGHGGSATAFGGNGGSAAHITYSPQHGGKGGFAIATGGSGGWGYTDYNCIQAGGNGGNGGSAYAYGGDGGNGWYAGQGGDAMANGGMGGSGAVAMSPTKGGKGGSANAYVGQMGKYNTDALGDDETMADEEPHATSTNGLDGPDGVACEP